MPDSLDKLKSSTQSLMTENLVYAPGRKLLSMADTVEGAAKSGVDKIKRFVALTDDERPGQKRRRLHGARDRDITLRKATRNRR